MHQFPLNGPFPKDINVAKEGEKKTHLVIDYQETLAIKEISETSGD